MRKTTTLLKTVFTLAIVVFLSAEQLKAQVVIGTPTLGFSRACASESFNSYNVSFIFSPEDALLPSNQFVVEMSDASGSFATPTVVYTSQPGEIVTSPALINFAIPETTAGESYKVRIKSLAPAASSSGSVSFPAYYKFQDSPFTINNLVATGAFCSGGSYLLTIDNPGSGSNDSPLKYPSLTYKWYRETGPTTAVFVADGASLEVSVPGTYFVKTNYGNCTSNSFSNRVKISEVTSGAANGSISSSLGNPFCSQNGMTVLSTINGSSYQWFKDGIAIEGATDQKYPTDQSGTFSVKVNLGNCTTTGSIDLVSEGFESQLNLDPINNIESGDTLTAIVTTNAIDPVYQWFYNGNVIPGITDDSYEVSEFGDYKVVVSQTSGCTVAKEHLFTVKEAVNFFPDISKIPNLISPNGDGVNDTWIIPTKYVTGTNTEVIIMNSQGKIMLQTTDYQNNWPENQLELNSINQVFYYIITTTDQQTKKGSITVVK